MESRHRMTERAASSWLANATGVPLRAALLSFIQAYGDAPVRVFRSPGRINLRGMHVDTHGGFLNLMTHQREVVVVCRAREDGACRFINTDARHAPFEFSFDDYALPDNNHAAWLNFIAKNEGASRGSWQAYVTGAMLRAAVSGGGRVGMDACIASDLPQGVALSSSSALCLSVYLAACGCMGHGPDEAESILACRDAEWFAGARTGTSDPAAMVLGRAGQLVNVALLAERFSLDNVRRTDFPSEEVAVLVVDSHTTRSLSGANLIAYTRNRFAYSVALEVLRQEMAWLGYRSEQLEYADRLSRINAEFFGGARFFAALLLRVPEKLDFDDLRLRYELPQLDALLEQYFGSIPRDEWPEDVPLRGPLVFGLAESERADLFFDHVEERMWEAAGKMMTLGHNGDRVVNADGTPFDRTVRSVDLAHFGDDNLQLPQLCGDYGASSPVLDMLVDTAMNAGAYGASLTGAGIAGSVLALCSRDKAEQVRAAWEALLCSEAYAQRAGFEQPLPPEVAKASVVENIATAQAGEV